MKIARCVFIFFGELFTHLPIIFLVQNTTFIHCEK